MPVWEHGAPGLAFLSRYSDGSCATITLAFASVALLWQGNLHWHICSKQQKPIFCITILCSYWVGARKHRTPKMTKMNDLFIQTVSSKSITASMKSRKTFPKIFRKLSQVTLIHQMLLSVRFTPPFRFDICEHVWIKDQILLFLCLNGWMLQMRFFITLEDPVLSIMATLKKWVSLLFSAFFSPLSLFFIFLLIC